MNKAVENLINAQQLAIKIRPKIGGFPYLAEILRQAGVTRNIWSLPSGQSLYLTRFGAVINQGSPLMAGITEVPTFNLDALIHALRTDQAGESTFAEFLASAWKAGVISYEVDFEKRHVTYYGVQGEKYLEEYPAVEL